MQQNAKIAEMIKSLIESSNINNRINYNNIVWPVLTRIWDECHLLKPPIHNINDLLSFVSPILALESDHIELTLQCSVCLAAKLTTTWEVILEPSCIMGKSNKGTRIRGFCDLLIVTSPFQSCIFEFKRNKKDLEQAKEEITGYLCNQSTKTLKILQEGREEDFGADQLYFDRYAVTGCEQGLYWELVSNSAVRNKIERVRNILFPENGKKD